MMITVSLQVIEQHIGGDVVGIPTVARLNALVSFAVTMHHLLAKQAIVLKIVNRL